jgi:putative transposase
VSVSSLVNSLKGVSSRMLRKEFPALRCHPGRFAFWSPSYFASSCGGVPLSAIRKYIESQDPARHSSPAQRPRLSGGKGGKMPENHPERGYG